MRILLTGATGFIGRILVPQIINDCPSVNIMCVVRNPEQAYKMLPKSNLIALCKNLEIKRIIDFNPNIVIHLAAYNTSLESADIINQLIESNITFGVELLEILTKCNNFGLFINTGSFSQYINGGEDAYLYSATKSAFEVFLRYFARTYGFKSVTVVPYSVYGGDKTVKRIMDYLIESIDAPIPVDMTLGNQQLDFIHVKDVARFYIALIKSNQDLLNGEIFHIGTGEPHSLREIAAILEDITGSKCNINWGARPYRKSDIIYAKAPYQEERDKIWNPHIKLEQGIRSMLYCE